MSNQPLLIVQTFIIESQTVGMCACVFCAKTFELTFHHLFQYLRFYSVKLLVEVSRGWKCIVLNVTELIL